MSFWTVIPASKEQIEKIYSKHLSGIFFKPINLKYGYDDEDEIGFVSFSVIKGHKVEYQFRNHKPCFVEFQMAAGDIRYDIPYPEGPIHDCLEKIGIKAEKHFWSGGEI